MAQSGHFPNRVLTTNEKPEDITSSWRDKWFLMDLGCGQTFDSVKVKASHNYEKRDGAIKELT